ncbi:hypothetical protein [Phaeospirillum tilakii]|uniref:Uncharacterized protein n=1 Tax=Phaeospirillum tilakii TaxID=741673 RepID=A0ABW5C748_9PROT
MSTALKLQPSLPADVPTPCRTQILLAATAVRASDRVVVIGPGSFDLLLGLARNGCKSATTLRSPARCRSEVSAADVVCFTGIEAIDADLATAIDHLETPRIVTIQLTRDSAKAGLASILDQLRAKGFADQAITQAGGRTLVVASRPAWLRRVI